MRGPMPANLEGVKKLLATAAATLLMGGLAAVPVTAAPGNGNAGGNAGGNGKGGSTVKEKGPALKLSVDMLKLSNVASFRCVAQVEDASAYEVVIESCQAFQGGMLVADGGGARTTSNSTATERWTGQLPSTADVTVCVYAHALLSNGAVLGHYICD